MCCRLNSCFCLPSIWDEPFDYQAKPLRDSPLDYFGFFTKCCWCVRLKCACVLICFITFIWAAMEMQTAEKTLRKLIDDDTAIYYLKLFYLFFTIGLMVAAAILLLGILMDKSLLVNIYIWYVMVYTPMVLVVYLVGSTLAIVKMGRVSIRIAIKLIFSIICGLLFSFNSEQLQVNIVVTYKHTPLLALASFNMVDYFSP
ncbi:hypothetical protein ABMA27_009356 [Loxostege sticticalis]|uniref:Uncharacterized protein n=1 Tax=Loxostege sticticalis TaxID=481309 RepID=A0ABR3H7Q4_LOXSC